MVYMTFTIISFLIALAGISLGRPISNFIGTLELNYGLRFGIEPSFLSSIVSSLYSFTSWYNFGFSFINFTLPIISGVVIGVVPFFFLRNMDLSIYGCIVTGIILAGVVAYFFPNWFNFFDNGFLILEIPIAIGTVTIGMTIAYWLLSFIKH